MAESRPQKALPCQTRGCCLTKHPLVWGVHRCARTIVHPKPLDVAPPAMPSLDDHDIERLRSLVGLRLVSVDQLDALARQSEDGHEAAGRWCRRMEALGLLTVSTVIAAASSSTEPVLRYAPGESTPDFCVIARALRSRAESAPQERVEVVRLSTHGAALLGEALPRASRRCELSHDLRLARYVLELQATGAVASWIPEDVLAKRRVYDQVVPDGELVLHTGERIVVECGGIYSRAKLASFHARLVPQLERRGASGYVLV